MLKKYWWIIAIGIIVMSVFFWLTKPKNNEVGEQNQVTITRSDINLPTLLSKANSVYWVTKNNIELPKIKKMIIQKQVIDEERDKKIKERLGINESNGYIDGVNNVIDFSENINSGKQLATSGEWNLEALKNKLEKVVEDINENNNIEILWTEVRYQKILFPRWIETNEKEAQSVEIKGDYIINGVRTSTYYGESITGIFDRNSKLIKLYLSLIPNYEVKDEDESLINIDMASQSPIKMYGIFDNPGIEKIDKVNITGAEIIEVYDNKRNLIKPYYRLKGNTLNGDKPVTITLLLKAEE